MSLFLRFSEHVVSNLKQVKIGPLSGTSKRRRRDELINLAKNCPPRRYNIIGDSPGIAELWRPERGEVDTPFTD